MNLTTELEVLQYRAPNGRVPFQEWRRGIKDQTTRQRVDARLDRVRAENVGDHKDLGDGLHELRLAFGPGMRIYFAWAGAAIVVLLAGGDKSSQARDISTARTYLNDLLTRSGSHGYS